MYKKGQKIIQENDKNDKIVELQNPKMKRKKMTKKKMNNLENKILFLGLRKIQT